jgi:exportin-T
LAPQVLGELAGLIKKIYATRGDELLDYLLNVYFPRINCPAEVAREMSAGLKTLDVKAYKRSLGQWCQLGR